MIRRRRSSRLLLIGLGLLLCVGAALARTPAGHGEGPPGDVDLERAKRTLWEARSWGMAPVTGSRPEPLGSAEPAGSFAWERMVVQRFLGDNFELVLSDTRGFRMQQLTHTPANEIDPKLSRLATDIVYVSDRDGNHELYRMRVADGATWRLTHSPASDIDPVWSPDDRQIVFASDRAGQYDLYLINADGSGETRLTADPAPDIMPTWSPDGRYLAWVRVGADGHGTLLRLDLHGGAPVPLTPSFRFLQHPDWSPDGDRLAFDCDCDGDFWNEIAVLNLNNHSLLLDYNPAASGRRWTDAWNGSWGPDGESLFFTLVHFTVSNGRLVLSDAYTYESRFIGRVSRLTDRDREFAPHVRSLDPEPPVARLAPYDRYTRSPDSDIVVFHDVADVGPSGLDMFNLRVEDSDSVVHDVYYSHDYSLPSIRISGHWGEPYTFALQAYDNAHNVSDWWSPPYPMTLYGWEASGVVHDQRGIPVVNAALTDGPWPIVLTVPPDLEGRYRLLSGTAGRSAHRLRAAATGYGVATPRHIQRPDDADVTNLRLSIPPQPTFVTNGGFDTGTVGWRSHGVVSTDGQAFAGEGALRLGPGAGTVGATHAVTQSVSVPAVAHLPTLSFEYRQETTAGQTSTLELLVNGVPQWSSSTDSGPDWQHVWLDFGLWAGQSVELAFRLTEPVGGSAEALLDDVQLGEWWTPVVFAVEGTTTPGQSSAIIIRGENFDPAAEVLLDDTQLPRVQWDDAQTLTVTIPAQSPGYYDLVVRNPGGQLGGALLSVGAPTFVPQIVR